MTVALFNPHINKSFLVFQLSWTFFHACQRFVKNDDFGENRSMNTPCMQEIESNLAMFLKKWENELC